MQNHSPNPTLQCPLQTLPRGPGQCCSLPGEHKFVPSPFKHLPMAPSYGTGHSQESRQKQEEKLLLHHPRRGPAVSMIPPCLLKLKEVKPLVWALQQERRNLPLTTLKPSPAEHHAPVSLLIFIILSNLLKRSRPGRDWQACNNQSLRRGARWEECKIALPD